MKSRKKQYTLGVHQSPDELFPYEETAEERLGAMGDRSIIKYRTKTVKSGGVLECEIYPIWNTRGALPRQKKTLESRVAQKNLNDKNTLKRVIRLVNANFTDADIWATFTYDDRHLPKTVEEAERCFGNFLRRLKYYGKKHGFPALKYVYMTHFDEGQERGGQRANHHIFTNFPDRDIMEAFWKGGARTQTRRLQSDESGYEGAVRYCMQDPRGKKRYKTSRNLVQPTVTVADTKFTRRRVERIVRGDVNSVDVFEGLYEGWRMTHIHWQFSDYVSGAYLYVKMAREGPPSNRKPTKKRRNKA